MQHSIVGSGGVPVCLSYAVELQAVSTARLELEAADYIGTITELDAAVFKVLCEEATNSGIAPDQLLNEELLQAQGFNPDEAKLFAWYLLQYTFEASSCACQNFPQELTTAHAFRQEMALTLGHWQIAMADGERNFNVRNLSSRTIQNLLCVAIHTLQKREDNHGLTTFEKSLLRKVPREVLAARGSPDYYADPEPTDSARVYCGAEENAVQKLGLTQLESKLFVLYMQHLSTIETRNLLQREHAESSQANSTQRAHSFWPELYPIKRLRQQIKTVLDEQNPWLVDGGSGAVQALSRKKIDAIMNIVIRATGVLAFQMLGTDRALTAQIIELHKQLMQARSEARAATTPTALQPVFTAQSHEEEVAPFPVPASPVHSELFEFDSGGEFATPHPFALDGVPIEWGSQGSSGLSEVDALPLEEPVALGDDVFNPNVNLDNKARKALVKLARLSYAIEFAEADPLIMQLQALSVADKRLLVNWLVDSGLSQVTYVSKKLIKPRIRIGTLSDRMKQFIIGALNNDQRVYLR